MKIVTRAEYFDWLTTLEFMPRETNDNRPEPIGAFENRSLWPFFLICVALFSFGLGMYHASARTHTDAPVAVEFDYYPPEGE